jgi:hypothetical protein
MPLAACIRQDETLNSFSWRSPTDVHAAPHAAATADTAMDMAIQASLSIAQATGIRVRQAATVTGPERPNNQTWTP